MELAWPRMLRQIDAHAGDCFEMTIDTDNRALIDAVAAAGFEPTDELGVSTWMPVVERPDITELPGGLSPPARGGLATPGDARMLAVEGGLHRLERRGAGPVSRRGLSSGDPEPHIPQEIRKYVTVTPGC
jgi:hypothetical protein